MSDTKLKLARKNLAAMTGRLRSDPHPDALKRQIAATKKLIRELEDAGFTG